MYHHHNLLFLLSFGLSRRLAKKNPRTHRDPELLSFQSHSITALLIDCISSLIAVHRESILHQNSTYLQKTRPDPLEINCPCGELFHYSIEYPT